jgi:hypothetical protein
MRMTVTSPWPSSAEEVRTSNAVFVQLDFGPGAIVRAAAQAGIFEGRGKTPCAYEVLSGNGSRFEKVDIRYFVI